MRGFRLFMLIGVLAAMSLPMVSTPTAQAPVRDAATVLAEAREALGGEKRLSAVKNFVVTGRTRQVRGDNLVPIEFEIAVELPDKYVRKDEIPAQESGPTSTGFNGDELIQLPVPATPTPPRRRGTSRGTGDATVTGATRGRAQDAGGHGEGGLRKADARDVRWIIQFVSPHLQVCRAGGGTAGQGRCR